MRKAQTGREEVFLSLFLQPEGFSLAHGLNWLEFGFGCGVAACLHHGSSHWSASGEQSTILRASFSCCSYQLSVRYTVNSEWYPTWKWMIIYALSETRYGGSHRLFTVKYSASADESSAESLNAVQLTSHSSRMKRLPRLSPKHMSSARARLMRLWDCFQDIILVSLTYLLITLQGKRIT